MPVVYGKENKRVLVARLRNTYLRPFALPVHHQHPLVPPVPIGGKFKYTPLQIFVNSYRK